MKRLVSIILSLLILFNIAFFTTNALQASSSSDISPTWELGMINLTTSSSGYGGAVASNAHIRCNTYFSVYGVSSITFTKLTSASASLNGLFYDANKKPLTPTLGFVSSAGAITSTQTISLSNFSADARYVRFHMWTGTGNAQTVDKGSTWRITFNKTVDPSIIDTSQKGTLSIHKYEMDDASASIDYIESEWELGMINTTSTSSDYGKAVASNEHIRDSSFYDVSNYISVKFDKVDRAVSSSVNGVFYDADKNPVSTVNDVESTKHISVPANAHYLRVCISTGTGDAQTVDKGSSWQFTGVISNMEYNGTGNNTDANYVPERAKPLQGVSFRITRVIAIDSSGTYYYNSSGTKTNTSLYALAGGNLPTVADAKTYKWLNDSGAVTTTERTRQTTNSSGVATFSNLPLGVYLVEEMSSPSQVVGAVSDFLVSIPMTNASGNSWKYSVDVYPKNETRYQTITLEKVDENTGEGIPDVKFNLQKTTNGGATWSNVETNLVTDSFGTVSPTNPLAVKCVYRFLETQANPDYIFDSTNNAYLFYVNKEGNVCDTTSSHNIIDESNPHRIQITNTRPSIEKFIDKSKGNNSELVKSSAVIRSDANYDYYSIKIRTPDVDMSSMRTFTLTDAVPGRDGLGIPSVTKVVKDDGTTLATSGYSTSFSPGYSSTGPYNLTVTFVPSALTRNTDYYVLVRTNVGMHDVSNSARITYSTNLTGTETTSHLDSDTVNFYHFGYKLKKIDGNSGSALSNVEFKLYNTRDDAEKNQNLVTTATTSSSGIAQFSYLNIGDRPYDDIEFLSDLTWEQGFINDNGTSCKQGNEPSGVSYSKSIRSNFFDITDCASVSYLSNSSVWLNAYWYDENHQFISTNAVSYADVTPQTAKTMNAPTNAYYVRFCLRETATYPLTIEPDYAGIIGSLTRACIVRGTYYVVESKTQDGYDLLSEPFEITVDTHSWNVSESDMTFVRNFHKSEFPMTGGNGVILLVSCGVLCMMFAIIIYVRKKRLLSNK